MAGSDTPMHRITGAELAGRLRDVTHAMAEHEDAQLAACSARQSSLIVVNKRLICLLSDICTALAERERHP